MHKVKLFLKRLVISTIIAKEIWTHLPWATIEEILQLYQEASLILALKGSLRLIWMNTFHMMMIDVLVAKNVWNMKRNLYNTSTLKVYSPVTKLPTQKEILITTKLNLLIMIKRNSQWKALINLQEILLQWIKLTIKPIQLIKKRELWVKREMSKI
jgi:hypothetical protein